jgi:hypothetical protein
LIDHFSTVALSYLCKMCLNSVMMGRMCLDPDYSPDEQEEKARLISQVLSTAQVYIMYTGLFRLKGRPAHVQL